MKRAIFGDERAAAIGLEIGSLHLDLSEIDPGPRLPARTRIQPCGSQIKASMRLRCMQGRRANPDMTNAATFAKGRREAGRTWGLPGCSGRPLVHGRFERVGIFAVIAIAPQRWRCGVDVGRRAAASR